MIFLLLSKSYLIAFLPHRESPCTSVTKALKAMFACGTRWGRSVQEFFFSFCISFLDFSPLTLFCLLVLKKKKNTLQEAMPMMSILSFSIHLLRLLFLSFLLYSELEAINRGAQAEIRAHTQVRFQKKKKKKKKKIFFRFPHFFFFLHTITQHTKSHPTHTLTNFHSLFFFFTQPYDQSGDL